MILSFLIGKRRWYRSRTENLIQVAAGANRICVVRTAEAKATGLVSVIKCFPSPNEAPRAAVSHI